ncbi:MAG: outer membrane beta-barrel protein [Ignavibacteriaceae bacterium]|nr:outer membrane beta-barrel protein [Ignavibacteriaceae bacterium]HRI46157.1 OmpW family outer membrane protein [Ignavibacteriaceae bacterium]
MKKLLVVALLLVMSANFNIFAQPVSGSKAILFQFSGLSFLQANEFEGGAGAKYFLNNRIAVRGLVKFSNSSSVTPWNGVSAGNDGESSTTMLGLGAAVQYYMTIGEMSPYFGGGAAFSTTSSETKSAYPNGGSQTVTKDDPATNAGTRIDVYALLGVEYFIKENISLSAEYRLGYGSLSRADYSITSGGTTTTTKQGSSSSLGINSQGLLTIAFYW